MDHIHESQAQPKNQNIMWYQLYRILTRKAKTPSFTDRINGKINTLKNIVARKLGVIFEIKVPGTPQKDGQIR